MLKPLKRFFCYPNGYLIAHKPQLQSAVVRKIASRGCILVQLYDWDTFSGLTGRPSRAILMKILQSSIERDLSGQHVISVTAKSLFASARGSGREVQGLSPV